MLNCNNGDKYVNRRVLPFNNHICCFLLYKLNKKQQAVIKPQPTTIVLAYASLIIVFCNNSIINIVIMEINALTKGHLTTTHVVSCFIN